MVWEELRGRAMGKRRYFTKEIVAALRVFVVNLIS
jgi:hypothetical protein